MASIALVASGSLFKIESAASPGTYTTIPEVIRLGAPSVRFDILDVTSHDSGNFREYIPGLSDPENATAEVNWRASNATHLSLRTDSYARTKKNFKIFFAGETTDHVVTFAGYITGIQMTLNVGEVQRATVTVKVTGTPAWAAT